MEPLISVIIPAHNAEQTLQRTVDSIQNGISEIIPYEILIIENNSSDKTNDIAELLQSERVRVFNSKKGVSNARNRGIEQAVGKWLMFVDADDMLLENTAVVLREVLKNDGVDFFAFGHQAGGKEKPVCDSKEHYYRTDVASLFVKMLGEPTKYLQVWSKLFRKEIIVKNHIRFDTTLRLAEDSDFTIQYLRHCSIVEMCSECIYYYTVSGTSTMRTFDGQKVADYAKAMEITQAKLEDEPKDIKAAYWQYVLTHFHIAMVNEVFSWSNTERFGQKKNRMQQAMQIPIFAQSIQKTKGQRQSKANCILGSLLRRKMYGVAALIYEMRALQKKVKEAE